MKDPGTPLLVIGLGGTGMDALLAVKKTFHDRYAYREMPERPATAYLAIDMDDDDPLETMHNRELSERQVCCLKTQYTGSDRIEPPYITEWIDPRALTLAHQYFENTSRRMGREWMCILLAPGAEAAYAEKMAISRQAGRYWLFRYADKIVYQLRMAIGDLWHYCRRPVEIALLTGIVGGVGSGMFLDLAYLIRYVMNEWFERWTWRITAYVFTPDVDLSWFRGGPTGPYRQTRMEANGFAALKELDFWMKSGMHGHAFTQQYSETVSVAWDRPPFDDVVLLDNAKPDGRPGPDDYENTMALFGEWLAKRYAVEDGMITQHRPDAPNLTPCRHYPGVEAYMGVSMSEHKDECEFGEHKCLQFQYAGLGRLESSYEFALERDFAGLHLVSKPWDPRRTLASDWSLLASPVMHEIVGQPMPPTVKQRRRTIAGLLKTGIETGFISLESTADEESLSITLRQLDGEDKTITVTYPSYTELFARAHGLDPNAAEGAQTARRLAAEYVLYAWYPHLVDQLRAQCDTLFTGT